ncbi:hypothetical protein GQ600_583 [Phytophthora cactorum]|nr:hypothetical protein GQ600_583 [Phytophthora cactorum]
MLPTLSIRSVPKTKKAHIYSGRLQQRYRFVFPRQFVEKAQEAVLAFRKTLVGNCADDSIGSLWPNDTPVWSIWKRQKSQSMSHKHLHQRITVPEPLADGVSSEPKEWERAIRLLLLHGARENPAISRAPGAAQDGWIGDNCMGHGMRYFSVNIHTLDYRFQARDAQLRAINAGDP